ncbi:LysE family translocator [Nonomuraea sp. NPDC050643]|uniref:LysE family translocator n=1 Tax=Nonomuraea sp. NPDC050643 TaxID=3155660 RepID=UPI0033DD6A2A
MIHPYAVAGFLLAILPLIATPGASLTLLVGQVTTGGRRQALPVILGTTTGLYVHATLALAGLSALVMHSSQAFTAVKLTGAVYLIGLGIWTWRSTAPKEPRRHGQKSPYVQALLSNVLNPKAASIYLTLAPQFIAPERPFPAQILTLATAHALLMVLWLLTWAFLIHRATHVLRRPWFRQAIARITSLVLVTLGLRTALS